MLTPIKTRIQNKPEQRFSLAASPARVAVDHHDLRRRIEVRRQERGETDPANGQPQNFVCRTI